MRAECSSRRSTRSTCSSAWVGVSRETSSPGLTRSIPSPESARSTGPEESLLPLGPAWAASLPGAPSPECDVPRETSVSGSLSTAVPGTSISRSESARLPSASRLGQPSRLRRPEVEPQGHPSPRLVRARRSIPASNHRVRPRIRADPQPWARTAAGTRPNHADLRHRAGPGLSAYWRSAGPDRSLPAELRAFRSMARA